MKKKAITFLCTLLLFLGMTWIPELNTCAADTYSFSGEAHVQTYGDKQGVYKNNTLTLGTTGQSKRLEHIKINFLNQTGFDGSIEYRVHRQTYGWTNWVSSGQYAGTKGEGKRLEGIQIRLTGEIAMHYSIRYRVHIQTYGWNQGWQYDGALAGTTGQAKRLEGIEIALRGNAFSGSIVYSTHVQSYGWMDEVSNGMMSGTSGKAKRLEAIKIHLTGEIATYYDIYYRVHAQSFGWLGWAKNGEPSGTSACAKRLEAIQIVLVQKGEPAPGNTYNGVTSNTSKGYVEGPVSSPSGSSTSSGNNSGSSSSSGNGSSSGSKIPPEETGSNLVWIPTNGGTKYHSNPNCSKMNNPRQVSLETAKSYGYTACKKCY